MPPASTRPSIRARRYAVSSTHYLASLAAARILEAGGNFADAGVAAGLAINVVQPQNTSLGGVAPIMVYLAAERRVETISGLGRWSGTVTLERFRQRYGDEMPPGAARTVVPAAVDAWLTALERYGRLPLAEVALPAIELAEQGWAVGPQLPRTLAQEWPIVSGWPSSLALYAPRGRAVAVGELFVQPDLARVLKALVDAERAAAPRGRAAGIGAARELFYRGEVAATMARFCSEQGGWLTREDLASFRVGVEPPVQTTYRGYEVYACGPWCQGPSFLQALNILECLDLAALGHNSPAYLHALVEAVKLAFADRDRYYGDPETTPVPLAGLLAKDYAGRQAARIDPERAHPGLPDPGDPSGSAGGADRWPRAAIGRAPSPADTAYCCVVDADGNAWSATPSDPTVWSPIVPGLGFSVSARGCQSWLDPAHPSVLGPGRRPRLTPNPALVLRGGRLFMPFGTPGGDGQVQAMLQVLLNVVEFGMDVQVAIEQPRVIGESFPNSFWPHQFKPGWLNVEREVPAEVAEELATRGHDVHPWREDEPLAGRVCAITVDPLSGTLAAGADPRADNYALGR